MTESIEIDAAEQSELRKRAWRYGWDRAPYDKLTVGHFNNQFPEGEPEWRGYKAFVESVTKGVMV